MKFKEIFFTCLLIVPLIFVAPHVQASTNGQDTLIVYSATQQNPPLVEQIEAMISPYTKSIVRSYDDVNEKDLVGIKSIIYIGLKKEQIDGITKSSLKDVKKLIIGENIEQFDGFESVKRGAQNQLAAVNGIPFEKSFQIQHLINNKGKPVVTEKSEGQGKPIIWQNKNQYYLPTTSIPQQLQWAIQPTIVDFFDWHTNNVQQAVIVIDQITPNTKVEKLNKVVRILENAEIPVVLAIQPLGQGDQENRLTTLDENKKLRKKIIELQKQGATIILSGFKPVIEKESLLQSEFWQMDLDQPMKEAMESADLTTIDRNSFPSENAYNQKRQEIGVEEQQQSRERWNEAIDESVNAGIIPTGMTIENDGASNFVYKEMSKKTTSFIGNIQFGDSINDIVLQPTIFQSKLLNGVTVFPINLQPNKSMDGQLKQLQLIDGAFAGVKVHVDDSLEILNSTIQKMDQLPSFQWVVPAEIQGKIQSDLVMITPTPNGETKVEKPNKLSFQLKMLYKNNLFEFVLWILFGLVLLFVILFFLNVIRLRISLKKRLFEERKPNG